MSTKKKQGLFDLNFFKLLTVFFILAMVGCGDGDGDDVPKEPIPSSLVLTTSLPTGDELAQGGTTTVTATVYNNDDGTLADDGTPVTFTTTDGIITGTVLTASGQATATFSAGSATGAVTITAQASAVDNVEISDDLTLIVASGSAAWIELVSISPDRIGLKGTGFDEVGLLTFNVKDASGNPVANGTLVDFSLESETGGGEYVFPTTGITNEGQVEVSLVSGDVAGVATVTATTNVGTTPVSTEARVTMGYGKPDQEHLSVFFEKLNVPGQILFNLPNTISVAVADRNSNPVPANTPVYFASECGIVSLDSNLTDPIGVASVQWITANPVDSLCTSIVWTEGEEAYVDSNGNGVYDNGEPHTPIGEPYIDANDNGEFDAGTEFYYDLDENGAYTPGDSVWDDETFVWTSGVIRWSGSTATPVISPSSFSLAPGATQSFNITVADVDGGPLPKGTKIEISTSCSDTELIGETDITLADVVYPGPGRTEFDVALSSTLVVPDDDSSKPDDVCSLTVDVTAAVNGNRTSSASGVRVGF